MKDPVVPPSSLEPRPRARRTRTEPPWESVRELYQMLRGVAREALAPHELLVSEYQTLRLCERGAVPLKAITRSLGVTPAATTDLARRLVRRRLLRVSPHATDRRSRVVTLTPAGRRRLAAARRSYARALRRLGVRLSPTAREGLRRGVSELYRAVVTKRRPARDPG